MTDRDEFVIKGQATSQRIAAQGVPASAGPWMLTGGAGYIGSHVARALLAAGERVVVLDDLSTGRFERVPDGVPLVVASVADGAAVQRALTEHRVRGVIHLAAKKSVPDSCAAPQDYYQENVVGLLSLMEAMRATGVGRLVFSSSAAVYGTPDADTVDEHAATRPESPYGRTKLVGEWMVRDACAAYGLSAVSLRYFNVVGCAEPALADVGGTNLFPRILDHLAAEVPMTVFGADCPTPDGTCVRDYIHVSDLAQAHVAAARLTASRGCDEVVNIGCGRGYSVLEVLAEFARNVGHAIPYRVLDRRPGDPAAMVADATKARVVLGWTPRCTLTEMVADTWNAALSARPAVPVGAEPRG